VPREARERELAARLRAGDEAALRAVYRELAPAVHGLATRVLGNATLAEDVTQEVFVRLWEHPERFDAQRGPLRSFLLAMTHSRAVERVRAEESLTRRHQAFARDVETVVGASPSPDDGLGADDTRMAVQRALGALPDDQRVPIEMAYFDGLTYRQVATALGEPEGTVKYRIRVGMRTLRAALRAVEVTP
jgi:RNA polymerase sigma-70 factor (ECF subfamily)